MQLHGTRTCSTRFQQAFHATSLVIYREHAFAHVIAHTIALPLFIAHARMRMYMRDERAATRMPGRHEAHARESRGARHIAACRPATIFVTLDELFYDTGPDAACPRPPRIHAQPRSDMARVALSDSRVLTPYPDGALVARGTDAADPSNSLLSGGESGRACTFEQNEITACAPRESCREVAKTA